MAAAAYQLTLQDYLSIVRRRALLLGGVFSIVLVGALVIALVLPPVFQSTGTILIEGQQIPKDMIQSTVSGFAEERIEITRQRVMTRDNLIKVIDKYKLFQEERQSLPASELVDQMRKGITVELVSADNPAVRRGKITIAFKLSFDHRSPTTAYQIANELVTLYLEENAKTRTERAAETTEFLAKEAERLKVNLETIEQQLGAYKQEHADALPEHQQLRMGMLARVEADLNNIERDYKATRDELAFLDIELSAARSGVNAPLLPQGSVLNPAQELERLRNELAKLSGIYTETHPDVRDLKRKIEALSKSLGKGGTAPAGTVGSAIDLTVAKVEARIATANHRLASLSQQQKALKEKRSALEAEIIRSPQVERSLAALMRDHESAQKKYEEVRSKEMSAQMAENLEEGKKAERFVLLEPPQLPEKPIKPDRVRIVLIGLAVALGGSGSLVLLLEMWNPRIRGAAALGAVLGHKPLVIIPYIPTQAEKARRKRSIWKFLVAGIAFVIVGLLALHFLYMSLDVLLQRILSRFS